MSLNYEDFKNNEAVRRIINFVVADEVEKINEMLMENKNEDENYNWITVSAYCMTMEEYEYVNVRRLMDSF